MDDIVPRLLEVFLDVQRGLPRQGPGDDASTHRALALCGELPEDASVLDIGCGPGMQTLALADQLAGKITAVDTCEEYLNELREKISERGLSDRVQVENADMAALGFPPATFDLIWCEGAAYIMGIAQALKTWWPLLREQGDLAFTELVWLKESPATEIAEFFADAYPAMTTPAAIKETIRAHGYTPIADFTLPDSCWWDNYYTPLAAKLPPLKQKYATDEEALGIVGMTETEIDMRRRFGDSYGYQFFVSRVAS